MNHHPSRYTPLIRCPNQHEPDPLDRQPYRPPRLRHLGSLGPLIQGTTWKGVDAVGALPEESAYPG